MSTTYNFSNFPNAIVAFGDNRSHSTEYENLQESLTQLKKLSTGTAQVLEYGKEFAGNLVQCAETFSTVITVLSKLIGEVDNLYKELKNLEQKILNYTIEGKIRTLRSHLENLKAAKTSEAQKAFEVGQAIESFDELLPVFANKDSIFRERHYQGAPLFVYFCAILKSISLIAEQMPDYNSENLPKLKKEYQEVLDWYRKKCIGTRLASCYVQPMLIPTWSIPIPPFNISYTYDWDAHFESHREYYEDHGFLPWMKYAENLGGTGWRVWYSSVFYCSIVDTWDTRTYEEVTFKPLQLVLEDWSHHVAGARADGETLLQREILRTYRSRVDYVMRKFFDNASLITEKPSGRQTK